MTISASYVEGGWLYDSYASSVAGWNTSTYFVGNKNIFKNKNNIYILILSQARSRYTEFPATNIDPGITGSENLTSNRIIGTYDNSTQPNFISSNGNWTYVTNLNYEDNPYPSPAGNTQSKRKIYTSYYILQPTVDWYQIGYNPNFGQAGNGLLHSAYMPVSWNLWKISGECEPDVSFSRDSLNSLSRTISLGVYNSGLGIPSGNGYIFESAGNGGGRGYYTGLLTAPNSRDTLTSPGIIIADATFSMERTRGAYDISGTGVNWSTPAYDSSTKFSYISTEPGNPIPGNSSFFMSDFSTTPLAANGVPALIPQSTNTIKKQLRYEVGATGAKVPMIFWNMTTAQVVSGNSTVSSRISILTNRNTFEPGVSPNYSIDIRQNDTGPIPTYIRLVESRTEDRQKFNPITSAVTRSTRY